MIATQSDVRVVIVDDEPLAIEGIEARLTRLGGFIVVERCSTASSAIAAIRSHSPDLVFLDVRMGRLSGFDVIEEIGSANMPPVIFVSAFDTYAIAAFDAHALDYVLKPVDDVRFEKAVERARHRLSEARDSDLGRKLSAVLNDLFPGGDGAGSRRHSLDRLVIKDGKRTVVLDFDEIDWIEAQDDYVRLHVGGTSYLLRQTLGSLAGPLESRGYVRVHRSAIVNIAQVREIRHQPNGCAAVMLRGGTTISATRHYASGLSAALARIGGA